MGLAIKNNSCWVGEGGSGGGGKMGRGRRRGGGSKRRGKNSIEAKNRSFFSQKEAQLYYGDPPGNFLRISEITHRKVLKKKKKTKRAKKLAGEYCIVSCVLFEARLNPPEGDVLGKQELKECVLLLGFKKMNPC